MSLKLTKDTFIERYLREGIACCTRHRKYLLQFGIKENRCEKCGISEWNGKPLMCQLHHLNGNRNDNRLANLQMLCPNCHSQTENFQNKNTFIYAPKDKVCKNCGKHFKAKNDDQCYCSSKCRYEYELKHPKKKELPYTKEYMEELCQTYSSLTQMGIAINKSKEAVKRYLILYGLFDKYMLERDFNNKPVLQYNLNGELIKEWPSIRDASESLKLCHIPSVCKGIRKSSGGFLWRYKDSENTEASYDYNYNRKSVLQYDKEGNFIQEFNSVTDAVKALKVSRGNIDSCLRGKTSYANGFVWKYKDGEIPLHIEIPKYHNTEAKAILQCDLDGNVIKEYPSLYSIRKATGISLTALKNCLKGVTSSSHGYYWRYK